MYKTVTSFGTNLTNSFATQSPKIRFNQKVSYFEEKATASAHKQQPLMTREQMRTYLLGIQGECNYQEYADFEALNQGEVGVSVLAHYNPKFRSTGWEESQDEFNARVEAVVEAVRRRYPFIRLFRKVGGAECNYDSFVQVQLFNEDRQGYVLYQHGVFQQSLRPKWILQAISLFVRKFNLVVSVDCEHKDLVPLGGEPTGERLLEGVKVTIRQKEEPPKSQTAQSPTKQIVIKSSFCQSSASKMDIFKSKELNLYLLANENIKDQVRVYFSPTKTSNFMTTTNISQGDLVHRNYKSSGKKQPEGRLPVKLFTQSVQTNYLEQARFNDLVYGVKHYEISISGNCIKPQTTQVRVDELLGCDQQELMVSMRVERNDIVRCQLRVTCDGQQVRDAVVRVSRDSSEGYEVVEWREVEQYWFWAKVNSMYSIDVQRKDCFPQHRSLFVVADVDVAFDLVSCVQTQLRFRAFNVSEQSAPLERVKVEITQPEDVDKEVIVGETDVNGTYTCAGLMFKKLQLKAKRKGFLTASYEYDVLANSTGSLLSIPMLPDFYSLINQYHVIVYVPQRSNFQINFWMKCPDGTIINEKTPQHTHYKTKLEVVQKKSKLMNFSVHVQCMDPFLKSNVFQLYAANEKPKRQTLCGSPRQQQQQQQQQQVTTSRSINEVFLTTRISHQQFQRSPKKTMTDIVSQKIVDYCAEESIRVFVTFGHEVIHSFMIQTNLLTTNADKCLGLIDLDKRKFLFMDDNYVEEECQKPLKSLRLRQPPTPKKVDEGGLGSILSKITNQNIR